ncbi:unnamed protein product [Urochloa humidicola]
MQGQFYLLLTTSSCRLEDRDDLGCHCLALAQRDTDLGRLTNAQRRRRPSSTTRPTAAAAASMPCPGAPSFPCSCSPAPSASSMKSRKPGHGTAPLAMVAGRRVAAPATGAGG